jgi:hypothetical protein
VSSISSTIKAYLNFALELRSFLRQHETIDETIAIVKDQLAQRNDNFLKTLRTNVFEYTKSPYLKLLQAANITYEDVVKMVTESGLETTLESLYEAGIYVTFEELKGREPIIRNGIEMQVTVSDFDNPNLKPFMLGQSGGSTGAPTRTRIDLDHVRQNTRITNLVWHLDEITNVPTANWFGLMPITPGYTTGLRLARSGYRLDKFYTSTRTSGASPRWLFTIMSYLLVLMVRFQGCYFPFPEYVPLDNPLPIAKWIDSMLKKYGKCVLICSPSKAIRVCLSAEKHGLSLKGLNIQLGGEPMSDAKAKIMHRNGATTVERYSFNEVGALAQNCLKPSRPSDMHHLSHHSAIIQRPIEIHDQIVNAFCVTTLHPTGPKMLLNALTDDYGEINDHDCGCYYYNMGFKNHLYDVHSYQKLTTEGTTLIGNDLIHILETVLPQKFGGSLLDYQLVEQEDKSGLTRLYLYVDPSVSVTDNQQLVGEFLDALKESHGSAQLAQAEFRQANTIQIRRQAPLTNVRGKHFPIRTLKQNNLIKVTEIPIEN